ncbi:MAG TPA: UbiA family prenyltransferase [Methanoregulaceae archaeon]|nr:UbiA family prenyltransferase [Methanoregulaceae archaeon]
MTIRSYIDLMRLHFFFAWPLLFCSGYLLATTVYGNFSWPDFVRAALIGFFGFEAGFVLNDYIDRDYDIRDIESGRLTKYWRLFGTRPLTAGDITPRGALTLFIILVAIATFLIFTLPSPNSFYVFLIMIYSYSVEAFYQVKKRTQTLPIAQLIGRTDFALFPVAGYLAIGSPDMTALLYFMFFYPFALAHLGINDLIDAANDLARGMKSVTSLYGPSGTVIWIGGFTALHIFMALFFMSQLGWIARGGIILGIALLLIANLAISRDHTPDAGLKVLPLFHVAMIVYAGSIGLDAVI